MMERNVIGVDLDTPVYRIFPLKWLLPSIRDRVLVLPKPASWDDPFEAFLFKAAGSYGRYRVELDKLRAKLYGQCWMTRSESDAMWRIYSTAPPMNTDEPFTERVGLKVKTTVRKLFSALYASSDRLPELCFWVGRVRYLKQEEMDALGADNQAMMGMLTDPSARGHAESLLLKRDAFEHEHEVRFIYDANNGFDATQALYPFTVDPNATFDEVILDPRVSERNCRALHDELRRAGYHGSVSQSTLYVPPRYTIKF